MNTATAIRVNLHCHSTFSDGDLAPEGLAEKLAGAGVQFAALTDHDTTAGLARFKAALSRFSIGYVSGVELTAQHSGYGEIHVLAYGIDAEHPEFQERLHRLRAQASRGSWPPLSSDGQRQAGSAPMAKPLPLLEAINLVHQSGGLAFLSHPFTPDRDVQQVERLLKEDQAAGLDGIEAFYSPYPREVQQRLVRLAERFGLLVIGGSDFHGPDQPDTPIGGSDIPTTQWDAFRHALLKAHRSIKVPAPAKARRLLIPHGPAAGWKKFLVRIVLPTLVAIFLFFGMIFGVIIPSFEQKLMDRKRETIRDLTGFVCRTLADYDRETGGNGITRAAAQAKAAAWITKLRYGPEGKDYFWISDLQAKMVAHPYRSDLDGQDLSHFVDQRGHRIFVEFARIAREKGGGYVEYIWQWKDDPRRLVPKQSYVSLFAPWGWVIGTGLYIEDVQAEIHRLMKDMLQLMLVIILSLVGLLFVIVRESLRIERERHRMEDVLRHSHETYRTLAEAATEGIILALNGRCAVVNPMILFMLGYTEEEMMLMDLIDLLPDAAIRDDPGLAWMRSLQCSEFSLGHPCETRLKRKDGSLVDVWLSASPLTFAGKEGFIVIIRSESVND
ncbi:MAG: cache domain-containing protein [Verrucomicrobia bacterium]|nr:cache domain-containing protein [Verrucomicrobiota bacterium]MCG2681223.1 cache domain-containing protein [Kiritimatiellia bacterium]MBU4247334.1 cache domain-containing protein [Verrucomicrobiota bacterium]MBU4289828.1 cache domain-containing protein [Verrucomicrobiota bacterium]MBU4428844.1 cache domain-containing protein [Verrucomicrobiota bacterium]